MSLSMYALEFVILLPRHFSPRKSPKGNSLAELNPELAKQWHTSKNGDLTPSDFFAKSVEMILTEKAENNY